LDPAPFSGPFFAFFVGQEAQRAFSADVVEVDIGAQIPDRGWR
jgi:hypothetical protein